MGVQDNQRKLWAWCEDYIRLGMHTKGAPCLIRELLCTYD
jgi:hypothetical protein